MSLSSFLADVHQIRLDQDKLVSESEAQTQILSMIKDILVKIDKILDAPPDVIGIEVTPGATTTH